MQLSVRVQIVDSVSNSGVGVEEVRFGDEEIDASGACEVEHT